MERTEEDKIYQSGIPVILGKKEYTLRPLVIRESREWRKKLVSALGKLPEYLDVTTDNPDGFKAALGAMLSDMPEEVVGLFFDYAKELDRDEIESAATDAELSRAFEEVIKYAFPLSQTLTRTLRPLPTSPPSSSS